MGNCCFADDVSRFDQPALKYRYNETSNFYRLNYDIHDEIINFLDRKLLLRFISTNKRIRRTLMKPWYFRKISNVPSLANTSELFRADFEMYEQDQVHPKLLLKASSCPTRGDSVYFTREPEAMRMSKPPGVEYGQVDGGYELLFNSSVEYYTLKLTLAKAGFRRILLDPDPSLVGPGRLTVDCNLIWGRSANVQKFPLRHPNQRVNHFPQSFFLLGCKGGMARCIQKLAGSCEDQQQFNFMPFTLTFPDSKEDAGCVEAVDEVLNNAGSFILKPSRGSCGKGITVYGADRRSSLIQVMQSGQLPLPKAPTAEETPNEKQQSVCQRFVAQEYIGNPLLINGKKFDLRLYVAVTSVNPLTVYIHSKGLVRFAAEEYNDEDGNRSKYSALTNFSVGRKRLGKKVNRSASLDLTMMDADSPVDSPRESSTTHLEVGHLKWELDELRQYCNERKRGMLSGKLKAKDWNYDHLMEKCHQVITKTMIAVEGDMRKVIATIAESSDNPRCMTRNSFFELYGFDILLDDEMTPWLMEVNTFPSLESSSEMDYITKSTVLTDLLNMNLIEPFNRNSRLVAGYPKGSANDQKQALDQLKGDIASDAEVQKALARLADEQRWAGGFTRIFPTGTPASRELQKLIPEPSPLSVEVWKQLELKRGDI